MRQQRPLFFFLSLPCFPLSVGEKIGEGWGEWEGGNMTGLLESASSRIPAFLVHTDCFSRKTKLAGAHRRKKTDLSPPGDREDLLDYLDVLVACCSPGRAFMCPRRQCGCTFGTPRTEYQRPLRCQSVNASCRLLFPHALFVLPVPSLRSRVDSTHGHNLRFGRKLIPQARFSRLVAPMLDDRTSYHHSVFSIEGGWGSDFVCRTTDRIAIG